MKNMTAVLLSEVQKHNSTNYLLLVTYIPVPLGRVMNTKSMRAANEKT
jgi:hypothetical protein